MESAKAAQALKEGLRKTKFIFFSARKLAMEQLTEVTMLECSLWAETLP